MVLLKNDGNLLPLNDATRTIAVIGPNADSLDALVGNYYGTPSKPVTVLDGIRARFPERAHHYAQGTGPDRPGREPGARRCSVYGCQSCRTHGLNAEHFNGANLDRRRHVQGRRAERTCLLAARGRPTTSARWTGFLKAPESGEYRFRFASQNGYRVWVDEQARWSTNGAWATRRRSARAPSRSRPGTPIPSASRRSRRGHQRRPATGVEPAERRGAKRPSPRPRRPTW